MEVLQLHTLYQLATLMMGLALLYSLFRVSYIYSVRYYTDLRWCELGVFSERRNAYIHLGLSTLLMVCSVNAFTVAILLLSLVAALCYEHIVKDMQNACALQ
tara:strand:- start:609 stop:914 length:306 start_codon:yes stop_codon:yes gene_type:complete